MIGTWIAGGLVLAGLSARWNWWRLPARGLPVLMYHKIGDPPPGSRLRKLWVAADMFRRQLQYLRDRGHTPITFLDIAAGAPLPPRPVVITLDDGYQNNYTQAFPLLKEFGFKAVLYMVVNAVGRDNFWHDPSTEARLPMLSWPQLAEMSRGGVEIGSHTMNHPRLSRLSPAEVARELADSRRVLAEQLGVPPVSFANPYGDAADDPRVQRQIREAGYRWAVSVHQGKADLKGNPHCLRRIFVRGDDTMYDFHLNMTRGRARL